MKKNSSWLNLWHSGKKKKLRLSIILVSEPKMLSSCHGLLKYSVPVCSSPQSYALKTSLNWSIHRRNQSQTFFLNFLSEIKNTSVKQVKTESRERIVKNWINPE